MYIMLAAGEVGEKVWWDDTEKAMVTSKQGQLRAEIKGMGYD